MKLSPYKLQILRMIAEGARAHLHRGGDSFAFVGGGRVRIDSLLSLHEGGLVKDVEKPEKQWRGSTYQITKDGRAALREAGMLSAPKARRGAKRAK